MLCQNGVAGSDALLGLALLKVPVGGCDGGTKLLLTHGHDASRLAVLQSDISRP